jgi:pimeloyl-ACP methyl ester carboxylesterase
MHSFSRGSGHPVLFIHGMPTNGRLWTGVVDKMSGRFTCLTVDLPGLGRAPQGSDCAAHLDAMASQIENIRIEKGIERWHVVGHDAGSAIAVHYAHKYQERVESLALLSPALFPELKPFHLFRWIRRPVVGELLAPFVNAIFWKIVMRYAVDGRWNELSGVIEDFHAPFSGVRGAWRLMKVLRWGDPKDVLAALPAKLPELRVPTLIFQGSRDQAVPEKFAWRASGLIPHSRVVMVDSGHFIPLSRPDVVASELLRFFDSPLQA